MVNKHWKKILAVFIAITVVLAGAPGVAHFASAAPDDTAAGAADAADATDAAGTTDAAGATDAAGTDAAAGDGEAAGDEQQQQVDENGEVVQSGAVGKVDKSDWVTRKDYKLVTESDTYKMYLYEPRLSILLENKKTGRVIESTLSDSKDDGNSNATWNAYMKSGIVLTVMVGTKSTEQVDLILSNHDLTVTKTDNGFSAKLYFKDYQIGLTMNVALENDNLVVSVPDDSITEEKEGTYLNSVVMYPFMGYSFLDEEEGYMLIPDGNGALINLDNKEGRYVTGFSQMIYGKDCGFSDSETKEYLWDEIDMIQNANQVLAPIFGMAHTKSQVGYLGIVEKGVNRASVEVHPNGVMVNYNRCFARFLLRDLYVQPLNNSNSGTVTNAEQERTHSDLQVRYILLDGAEADYSSMAVKYRDYLLSNNMIQKKDSSYNTRVDFLGTERENFLLSTKSVPMTRVEDVEKIYRDLQSQGVSSVLSVYKGWQDGGLYNVPIKDYDVDRHIGSERNLTELINMSGKSNYKMYLYDDALRMNPKTNALNYSMIKKVNKRTFIEEVWAEVYDEFYYLTPETSNSYFKDFVESAADDGVRQIAVSGVSNTIYSYSYKGDFYTRNDTADAYSKMLDSVDEKTDMVLEKPSAFLWKNMDAFLDMPLGSSDYMYIDEEVPFLSMVLKGIVPMYSDYMNFEANKQEFFLQMVESGVFPSFYITNENSADLIYTNSADLYSTEYSTYKDSIMNYDKQLRALNTEIGDANIVSHSKKDGIATVVYSNGLRVYVNYTEKTQTVEGTTVDAMSYSYKAGEAE